MSPRSRYPSHYGVSLVRSVFDRIRPRLRVPFASEAARISRRPTTIRNRTGERIPRSGDTMVFLEGHAVAWAVVLIQSLGIASACLARLSQGCTCQRPFQILLLLCLPMVAAAGVVSFRFGPECWLTSGTLLAVMLVSSTFPLGRTREATAW